MRADYPIEVHTTAKCIAAPYQQSSNFTTRWASLYVNIGQLALDERARNKLKIFIEGRPEEGQTKRLISEQMRGHNGHVRRRFFWTGPILYHTFGIMVIFRLGNLYSLCSPGN